MDEKTKCAWPSTHPAMSNDLLRTMVKVFGLENKRVTALTLRLEFGKFARLTIERAPLEGESQALCQALDAFLSGECHDKTA